MYRIGRLGPRPGSRVADTQRSGSEPAQCAVVAPLEAVAAADLPRASILPAELPDTGDVTIDVVEVADDAAWPGAIDPGDAIAPEPEPVKGGADAVDPDADVTEPGEAVAVDCDDSLHPEEPDEPVVGESSGTETDADSVVRELVALTSTTPTPDADTQVVSIEADELAHADDDVQRVSTRPRRRLIGASTRVAKVAPPVRAVSIAEVLCAVHPNFFIPLPSGLRM